MSGSLAFGWTVSHSAIASLVVAYRMVCSPTMGVTTLSAFAYSGLLSYSKASRRNFVMMASHLPSATPFLP